MQDKRKNSLDEIIQYKRIKTVFQPIISLKDGSILGHEALSRITGESEIKNPEELFALASRYNRLWELEQLCRTTAFEAAFRFMIPPYDKMLFVNVNPNTMHDDNFNKGFTKEILLQHHIMPHNIIFEITERNVIADMSGFMQMIDHYKGQDYKIAIDDAGSGYSGLNLISDVKPNFIKIDMKLIRDIHKDRLKYALVKGMVEISRVSNIALIAEGIENHKELETIIDLGVQYGQGFLIQKPYDKILEIRAEVLQKINEFNEKYSKASLNSVSNTWIRNISTFTKIVPSNISANNVYNIFKNNKELFGLCIVENEIPVGIITYEKLALKMSGHYGFSLNQNKCISELMDKDFLSVDHQTPISTVSYLAMLRQSDKLYDFIVVTDAGKYVGTVTIKDLLQKTTEIEVDNAKNSNPLSGLPGNHVVEHRIRQCIEDNTAYSVAYVDIDNFKAYNDTYGFEKGDLVLKLLASILKERIPSEHFIGHIGGDDFVVILQEHIQEDYFYEIEEVFAREVQSLYHQEDIDNGYIITTNRRGETEKFPLITVTVVVENNQYQSFHNVYELTEVLAAKKRKEKMRKLMYFL